MLNSASGESFKATMIRCCCDFSIDSRTAVASRFPELLKARRISTLFCFKLPGWVRVGNIDMVDYLIVLLTPSSNLGV